MSLLNKLSYSLLFVSIVFLSGCFEKNIPVTVIPEPETVWWESKTPNVVIGDDAFYAGRCSITRVNSEMPQGEIIFSRSSNGFKSCSNRQDPLTYDGEYIILDVCEIVFAAGGCGGGKYRSRDYENWEEYIGVTWRNSEEYEAWRKLGSTSSKADSIKKVVRD